MEREKNRREGKGRKDNRKKVKQRTYTQKMRKRARKRPRSLFAGGEGVNCNGKGPDLDKSLKRLADWSYTPGIRWNSRKGMQENAKRKSKI